MQSKASPLERMIAEQKFFAELFFKKATAFLESFSC